MVSPFFLKMIDRLSSLHVVKTVSAYEQENYYRITVTTFIRTLHDNIVLSSRILYDQEIRACGTTGSVLSASSPKCTNYLILCLNIWLLQYATIAVLASKREAYASGRKSR